MNSSRQEADIRYLLNQSRIDLKNSEYIASFYAMLDLLKIDPKNKEAQSMLNEALVQVITNNQLTYLTRNDIFKGIKLLPKEIAVSFCNQALNADNALGKYLKGNESTKGKIEEYLDNLKKLTFFNPITHPFYEVDDLSKSPAKLIAELIEELNQYKVQRMQQGSTLFGTSKEKKISAVDGLIEALETKSAISEASIPILTEGRLGDIIKKEEYFSILPDTLQNEIKPSPKPPRP